MTTNHPRGGHRPGGRRRPLLRLAGAIALTLAVLAGSPGVAWAVVPTGTGLEFAPSTGHWGYADWNDTSDTLHAIEVDPGGSFGSNQCLVTIFDWKTSSGHFDARIARTCNSAKWFARSTVDSGKGRTLTGMQRFGVCYGPKGSSNISASMCTTDSRSEQSVLRTGAGSEDANGPNTAIPNNCAMSWRVDAGSTTVLFHAGGNSDSCSA